MVRRNIILMLLLLVCPVLLMAQNQNVVVRIKGNVQIMRKGEKLWNPLRERDTVKLFDKINLPANSSVSIMKTSTRAVFSTDQVGQMTVHDIIKKAENQGLAVIKNVIEESALNNSKRDFTSYGASVRGQEVESVTEAVYAHVYETINGILERGEIKEEKAFALSRIYADNMCSFKVTNFTDSTYYVNLVCVNLHKKDSDVCYPYGITTAILPDSEFTFPGEFYDSDDVIYILVASSVDFDSSLFSLKIRNGSTPKNIDSCREVFCSISGEVKKLCCK